MITMPIDTSNPSIDSPPHRYKPHEELPEPPYEGKMWGAAPFDQKQRIATLLCLWDEMVIPIAKTAHISLFPGCVVNKEIACCNKHKIIGEYDGTPCVGINPNAIPRYIHDRAVEAAFHSHHTFVEPPTPTAQPFPPQIMEVQDPVRLGFSLKNVLQDLDDAQYHEGVSMAQVWNNPLARMAWLIMKPITLTDQFFRKHCLEFAMEVRQFHPKVAEEVPIRFFFPDMWSSYMELRTAIYRYMVRTLIDMSDWPYMMPPRVLVADRQISWISLDDQ